METSTGQGTGSERKGAGPGTRVVAGMRLEDPKQMVATDNRDCAREARSRMEGKGVRQNDGLALGVPAGGNATRREGRGRGYQRGG